MHRTFFWEIQTANYKLEHRTYCLALKPPKCNRAFGRLSAFVLTACFEGQVSVYSNPFSFWQRLGISFCNFRLFLPFAHVPMCVGFWIWALYSVKLETQNDVLHARRNTGIASARLHTLQYPITILYTHPKATTHHASSKTTLYLPGGKLPSTGTPQSSASFSWKRWFSWRRSSLRVASLMTSGAAAVLNFTLPSASPCCTPMVTR